MGLTVAKKRRQKKRKAKSNQRASNKPRESHESTGRIGSQKSEEDASEGTQIASKAMRGFDEAKATDLALMLLKFPIKERQLVWLSLADSCGIEIDRLSEPAIKASLDATGEPLESHVYNALMTACQSGLVEMKTMPDGRGFSVRYRDPDWTAFREIHDEQMKKAMHPECRVFLNSRYQVYVLEVDKHDLPHYHLSIKRRDKGVIRSWRDLQRIKNEIVGPHCEGVELFPDEARLVDTANQFHLFVLKPGLKFPFGSNTRIVSSATIPGAVQEPFEPDNRPKDLVSSEELLAAIREAEKEQ